MEIHKVSIIGCGALGIMYANHIQRADPSVELQFIADRDRIERYQAAGIYANGVKQSFRFVSPDAGGAPSDLVIFMVKHNQLAEAIALAKNHIGGDTVIMSFLNGIMSEETIGKTYNPAKILHSIVAGLDATKSGTAVTFTTLGYVAFGSPEYEQSKQDIERVARFFDRICLKYEIQKDIIRTLWWKYMLNIGINQTSAVLRAPYGAFQSSSYAQAVMRQAMAEALEVSRKLDIGLKDGDIDDGINLIKTMSPQGKTSMLQDIEAKRPTEVDMFAGDLIELAKEHGVPVPVNTFLYNAIKYLESQF